MGFKDRLVKFSENAAELGWSEGTKYIGEWSFNNNKPYGRGIRISKNNRISICYWEDGYPAAGKFVHIFVDNDMFKVGDCFVSS